MELRQLEYFLAVAEERHFTRAAQRVHIVQSGLSASVHALERELGAPLFVRTTRHVELTEEGRALVGEARAVLEAAERARDAVAAVRGLLRGRLSVGTIQRLPAVDLAEMLGRFRERHPDVELRVRQASTESLIEDVRGGRLDVAFAAYPVHLLGGLAHTLLVTEPLLLACAPGHRLAHRKHVRLAELADETFIEFQPDWGTRIILDEAFAALGIERRIACEVNDLPTLLDLVAHQLGIAIVARVLGADRSDLRFVALAGNSPVWEVSMITRADGPVSAAARAFVDMLAG
jgi:DNA-binding transcriptional LysR family regulator